MIEARGTLDQQRSEFQSSLDWVESPTYGIVHLVELINQTNSLVGKNKRPSFERPLPRHGIFSDTRSQTDCTRTLTGCKDGSTCRLLNVLEELRLGRSGITKKENVDVTSDTMLPVDILHDTAKEGESDGRLDVVVTID